MAFNQQRAISTFTGAGTAFTAPLAAYKGSLIALNTVVAGATASTAGLVIANGGPNWNIEWESLVALVETNVTTSTITVSSKWQCSPDGVNWVDLVNLNGVAKLTIAAAGTASLITTQYFHPLSGINPGIAYMRLAVSPGVVTGAAGDNCTVSYFFRKRSFLA